MITQMPCQGNTQMREAVLARDYALSETNDQQAREAGLVSADWYHSPIPRAQLKAVASLVSFLVGRESGFCIGGNFPIDGDLRAKLGV